MKGDGSKGPRRQKSETELSLIGRKGQRSPYVYQNAWRLPNVFLFLVSCLGRLIIHELATTKYK